MQWARHYRDEKADLSGSARWWAGEFLMEKSRIVQEVNEMWVVSWKILFQEQGLRLGLRQQSSKNDLDLEWEVSGPIRNRAFHVKRTTYKHTC